MRVVLTLLCATFCLVLLSGVASADAMFTISSTAAVPCSAGSPCGDIVVANGAGLFLGDAVVTVSLDGTASDFQLDRFGFNSDLSLKLVCFVFGDRLCTKGDLGGASLQTGKTFGPYGKFDYNLLTGLNGGKDCCKDTFTFVIAQDNGKPLSAADLGGTFAGHAADPSKSGYIEAFTVTPEPSTLLLLGTALTGVATAIRRRAM